MMIINRKFLRERRHSRISRRHLCNSTAAAAFRFDVSARLRLLMARRYGVTRPPGPLPPSREKRGGGAGAQRKVRRHQSYKRIKGCTPRAFMDGRCSSRGGEGRGRRANGASERERERGHTHYLNARHSERRLVRSRSSLVVPTLPSSCPQSEATRFSPFFSFFSLSPHRLLRRHDSLPKYRRVPSAGVRPSSSGQSLRGGGGAGNRESAVPLSSVPSVNGTTRGF